MWKLIIDDDQANRTIVHLTRDEYGLGRSEDNSVRLTERNISRHHARLERNGKGWKLLDLDSYNGCFVNGERVRDVLELTAGDLIQLGDYRLSVQDEGQITEPDRSASAPPLSTHAMNVTADRMVMLVGPVIGAEFVLAAGRTVIGRGEECAISINHPSVSRAHAEIVPLGSSRYEIADLGSANGVRVNGVELPRSFMESRDVIELGDVILKFLPAGETYIPGSDDSRQLAAMGASRRREAEEADTPLARPGMSGLAKLMLAGGGLAIVLLAVFFVTRGTQTNELVSSKDETRERAAKILAEAKALLAEGDVRGAKHRASELPEGTARSSADFKAIQAAYADHLFEQAQKTGDANEKRALYDEIARSPSVDAERRKRAADELAAVGTQAVNVADLPSAPAGSVSAAEAPAEQEERHAVAPKAAPAPKPPPDLAEDEEEAEPAAPPPKKAPAAAAGSKPKGTTKTTSGTLVRESPF